MTAESCTVVEHPIFYYHLTTIADLAMNNPQAFEAIINSVK